MFCAPFSISAWANPDNITANHTPAGVFDDAASAVDALYLSFAGATGGDPVQAISASSGTFAVASSTAGFSAGSWQHGCAVFAATNSRAAYYNGANKGTNTTSNTPSGISRTILGKFNSNSTNASTDFVLAEVGMWNVALTDDEALTLSQGFSPLLVRPQSLVAYWPLYGRAGASGGEESWVGAFPLTHANSPAVVDHPPRIIYPSRPRIIIPAAAVGGFQAAWARGANSIIGVGARAA